jgi:hypothetical protein
VLKELKKLSEVKPSPPRRANPTQDHSNTEHNNTEAIHHIHSNRHRQTDTKDARISSYAEDNMTIVTKTEHVKTVQEITRRSGKAT